MSNKSPEEEHKAAQEAEEGRALWGEHREAFES